MQRNTLKSKIIEIKPKAPSVEIKNQSNLTRKVPLLAKSSVQELIKRYKKDIFSHLPLSSGAKAKKVIHRLQNMLEQTDLSDEQIINSFSIEQKNLEKSPYITHINQFLNEAKTPFYKINLNLVKKISDHLYSTDLANASAVSLFFQDYFSQQNIKRFGTGKCYLEPLWNHLTIKITLPTKSNPLPSRKISCVQKLGDHTAIGTSTGSIYICDKESISVKANNLGEINFHSNFVLGGHKSSIKNMVLHPNQSYWVSHSEGHQFCIWDRQYELKITQEFKRTTSTDFEESSQILSNGQIVFMQSNDIKIYEYHKQKNQLIHLHTLTESLHPQKIFALTNANGYIINDISSLPVTNTSRIYSIIFQGNKKIVESKELILRNFLSNNHALAIYIQEVGKKNQITKFKSQPRIIDGKTMEEYQCIDHPMGEVNILPSGVYFTHNQNTNTGFTICFYQDEKIKKTTNYLGGQIYFFGNHPKFFPMHDGNIFAINSNNETAILSFCDRKKIVNENRSRLQLQLEQKTETNNNLKI